MARLVRPDDFRRFAEKVRLLGVRRIANTLFRSERGRVEKAWSHTETDGSNWWELEAVVRRWNQLITGNPSLDYQTYVARTYVAKSKKLKGLSIGCGTGAKEVRWAETGKFALIEAFDVSPSRIHAARENAARSKAGRFLKFEIGDVHELQLAPASYDVVIFDNALHHCSPLDPLLEKVHRWMKKEGILVLNEYVGPDRFQWTDQQVELTDTLLRLLPESLRSMKNGRLKHRMARYGSLAIRINDPSEAAESSRIPGAVQNRFTLIELKPYGGTLVANVLKDIAHNFNDRNPVANRWLTTLFALEDALMNEKRISSDYVFAVLRKQA